MQQSDLCFVVESMDRIPKQQKLKTMQEELIKNMKKGKSKKKKRE